MRGWRVECEDIRANECFFAKADDRGATLALVESGAFDVIPMIDPSADDRSTSANGFTRLLERLHADPEQAGHEYERLRRALVKFFDWRGVPVPDECADERQAEHQDCVAAAH